LDSPAALERIGLPTCVPEDISMEHPSIQQQVMDAKLVGRMVVRFSYHRVKRHLHMLVGWPHYGVTLSDPAMRDEAIELLHNDHQSFEALVGLVGGTAVLVHRRHVCQWVCVQQLVAVCQQLHWSFDDSDQSREVAWFAKRFRLPLGSLFNETVFKYMRAREPGNRRMSHRGKWASSLLGPLVHEDFSYKHIDVNLAPPTNKEVPKTVFSPLFKESWEGVRHVAGKAKQPDWVTENSETSTHKFMDLLAMRWIALRHESNFGYLEYLWKTVLLDIEGLIVRENCSDTWMLPLGMVGNTGALAVELETIELPHADDGSTVSCYIPKLPVRKVSSCHVALIGSWLARTYDFAPPQWTMLHRGVHEVAGEAFPVQDKIGIVLFPTSDPVELPHAASKKAFGKLGPVILKRFAEHFEVSLRGCDMTLFGILVVLITHFLNPEEDELLDILLLRLEFHVPAWAALEDIPEVSGILGNDEVAELEEELQAQAKARTSHDKYARSYWRRRRVYNAARAAAGGGAGGHHSAWRRAPAHIQMAQGELAPHMPPRGAIWKNNSGACWSIHVGPWYRSFPWAAGGPNEAGEAALRAAWRLHLMMEGEGIAQCTVDGLFPEGAPELPSGALHL